MIHQLKNFWRWLRGQPSILRQSDLRYPLFAVLMDNPACHCEECGTNILTLQEDGKTSLCLYTNNLFGLSVASCSGAKVKRFNSWSELQPFLLHARDCHECSQIELDCDGDLAVATAAIDDLLAQGT